MNDMTSGSAIFSTPAPAPSGEAPASAPAPTGETQASAAPATGSSWYDGLNIDADMRGYLENKGWKDPADLAHGYRNLEKLVGGDKVAVPKSAEDAEGWSRVYDALGRPKSAGDYKLPVPEGDPGDFAKAASEEFHKAGISQAQAEKLASWWNQTQTSMIQQQQQAIAQKAEADMTALRREWGAAWDENVEFGRRASREFGLDAKKMDAIESSLGTGEMMKFLVRVGRALGEDNFVSGQGKGQFGMTPEAAKQQITALQGDRAFAAKYLNKDADAVAQMTRLQQLAFPEN